MPIDYDRLINLQIPEREQSYSARDAMLYALGLGLGMDPLDEVELRHVAAEQPAVLPTMAVTLANIPSFELDLGVDLVRAVHGDHSLVVHAPLPSSGTVVSRMTIARCVDLGADKGALLKIKRDIHDKATGKPLATSTMGMFCRADGGFGGGDAREKPVQLPERAADIVVERATTPREALIYRLSGDYNPLHSDPDRAIAAGFPRPILHGLSTYGICGWAIIRAVCGNDETALREMHGRFTSPVFPGETLKVEIWRDGADVAFRASVIERGKVVFDNGRAVVETSSLGSVDG